MRNSFPGKPEVRIYCAKDFHISLPLSVEFYQQQIYTYIIYTLYITFDIMTVLLWKHSPLNPCITISKQRSKLHLYVVNVKWYLHNGFLRNVVIELGAIYSTFSSFTVSRHNQQIAYETVSVYQCNTKTPEISIINNITK